MVIGIIFHAINIDEIQFRSPPAKDFDPNIIIDNKFSDLIWFLQVSDLHISNRGHYDRITDFEDFTNRYVDIFKPSAVLVTGDITDGRKLNSTFGSGPQLEEWQAYSKAVRDSGADKKTAWLDIRGNHDNFNVYRPKDPNILYRQYSIMGKTHERNYHYILKDKDGKNYSFFGVDEVQSPGLKIPFNFIGIVADEDITELKKFKQVALDHHSQYNIWLAHYPTSSVASPHEGIRNIIDGPYLCGHYHTIGNLVNKMHAGQQTGYVEVELGDWKYNRRIRLAAVDHQLFSLVDFRYKQFPVALMTNPKTAEHSMPKYEPVDRIKTSTHMRVIAFSDSNITKVEVAIDNESPIEMLHVEGPLYVLPWNPNLYSNGLHKARISVVDAEGKNTSYVQTFSMDNSKEDPTFMAKLSLRLHFRTGIMSIFFFVVVVSSLPLIILKLLPSELPSSSTRRHYQGTLLHRLHLLTKVSRIYWLLVVVPIWMCIGPLFVGYLVDEAVGACFVWGILIDNTFLYTGLTYNVGSIFLLLVHVPELILLAGQVSSAHRALKDNQEAASIIGPRFTIHLLIVAFHLFLGFLLISAYGLMAYFTSFPFFWCLLAYSTCWYQCTTLGKVDFVSLSGSESQEEQPLTGQTTPGDRSIN